MKRGGAARAVALAAFASAALAQTNPPTPYKDRTAAPSTYAAPDRDAPAPADLRDVAIGYFGPPDGADPESGSLWLGATLAIEDANRQGGYHGLPFRLAAGWAKNPWAGGVAALARVTFAEHVWAIVGGVDGATTHLVEQVVAKALVPLINPAATDRSVHAAFVPWMFSCVPGDDLLAPLLSAELRRRAAPFVVLSATDHDSRAFAAQLKTAFDRDHLAPQLQVEFDAAGAQWEEIAGRVAGHTGPVVVIASATASARLITAIRGRGFRGIVLAGPWIARAPRTAELAGVLYPLPGEASAEFRARFHARFGAKPDYAAAHAYDAVSIAVAAIRKAGLNRARIREAVMELSPYAGVTGRIEWDAMGQNRRAPLLREIAVP